MLNESPRIRVETEHFLHRAGQFKDHVFWHELFDGFREVMVFEHFSDKLAVEQRPRRRIGMPRPHDFHHHVSDGQRAGAGHRARW